MAGRRSAASLAVVARTAIDGRPAAPDDLTQSQKDIWERTVANEPGETFRTSALQQLLRMYCQHADTAARLAKQVDEAMREGSQVDLDDVDRLLKMRDRETKAVGDKATKLRLTNQSRYTPQAAGTAAKKASTERKPWQMTG